jgi:hypothetical protein
VDVATTLNSKYQVGVEFKACPVAGHNFHGQVERSIKEVKSLFDKVYRGMKMDIMGYETCFAWISNELNNLPLCLGNKYKNLDNLDLITPNRLIHGRSNRRAMSGPCKIGTYSATLDKMNDVFEAWWKAWYNEKLADFVAKPPKWFRSDELIKVGDIVVFQKKGVDQVIGRPIWSIGRVTSVAVSPKDGKIRTVNIEYKNHNEQVTRNTCRAVRSVAVLFSEGDLDLTQKLSAASREATKEYLKAEDNRTVEWSTAGEAGSYSEEFSYLAFECISIGDSNSFCGKAHLHEDPWGNVELPTPAVIVDAKGP